MDEVLNTAPLKPKGPSGTWLIIVGLALVLISGAGILWVKQLQRLRVDERPAVLGTVPDWTLTRQDGVQTGMADLKGRIWVGDFIFTRCGGPCPILTNKMQQLQTWLDKEQMGNVKLVTFTVDPDNDTTEVLQQYSKTWKADLDRWSFFTGDIAAINTLATQGFMLPAEPNPEATGPGDLFVHSERLILVDSDGQIRGMFSALEEEALPKLQAAIRAISREASTGKNL